jgi:hypothetical protein
VARRAPPATTRNGANAPKVSHCGCQRKDERFRNDCLKWPKGSPARTPAEDARADLVASESRLTSVDFRCCFAAHQTIRVPTTSSLSRMMLWRDRESRRRAASRDRRRAVAAEKDRAPRSCRPDASYARTAVIKFKRPCSGWRHGGGRASRADANGSRDCGIEQLTAITRPAVPTSRTV